MIYFYYGTDTEKISKRANLILESSIKKHPEATLIRINSEELSQERIDELVGTQALFYNRYLVYFYKIFENKNNKELILKNIKDLAKSENFFVFNEGKTDKASLTKIEKLAEKTEEFIKPERKLNKKEALAQKGEKIDFFDFSNALGSRNKKELWVLYQDALREQVPAEEVHGIFFWQIKIMLLAKKCKNAEEAEMKPYPFQKAKEYSKKYNKEGELESIAEKLVSMYHEAHRGNIDFHTVLEKFILEL